MEYVAAVEGEQKESKAPVEVANSSDNPHLMIFVIDSSASMQATTHIESGIKLHVSTKESKTFTHVSRLQFVQSAVRAKIVALARDDPAAVPLIIHFGHNVTVCCPDGTRQIIGGSMLILDLT